MIKDFQIMEFIFLLIEKNFLHLFIFEKQSERKHEQGRGRERRRHRIWSRLQHRAWWQGSNPRTVRSWPKSKSDAQLTEPPRSPKESPNCFPEWLHQFAFPPAVQKRSSFSTSSPISVVSWVVNFSHSDRCEVVFHFGFDLDFPDDERCWEIGRASCRERVCLYV